MNKNEYVFHYCDVTWMLIFCVKSYCDQKHKCVFHYCDVKWMLTLCVKTYCDQNYKYVFRYCDVKWRLTLCVKTYFEEKYKYVFHYCDVTWMLTLCVKTYYEHLRCLHVIMPSYVFYIIPRQCLDITWYWDSSLKKDNHILCHQCHPIWWHDYARSWGPISQKVYELTI